MDIGQKIKMLRIKNGLTQEDLAEAANTTKQTIHKYETGIISNIPASKVKAIADKLATTPAYLMAWEEVPNQHTGGVKIPVVGCVAAGIPIEAIEDIIGYEEIPESMSKKGDFFGLRIKGNSMEPQICDGDIVIVRKQKDVESGEIAIVIVNGDEGVCKKVIKHENGISLVSLNPLYDPMFFSPNEIEEKPVTICGKVVELRRSF